jgi:tRNA dimethylallyltransferase
MDSLLERKKERVIAIVGPTCTGKTALSIHLSRAFTGEVVGCDSRTIYRYMDIGTAKPTVAERAGIPHHMFDVVDPDHGYTVAQYKQAASAAINDIHSRGGTAIVCGGTGLYAAALLQGLSIPEVAPQPQLRQAFARLADEQGNEHLHAKLKELDPVTADRLNPNDRFRVIRALEVATVAGKPMSQLAATNQPEFHTIWIGLTVQDRSFLKNAIACRMEEQLKAGLVDEVRELFDRYGCTLALMKAVNYREFIDHFSGKIKFDEAIQECVRHNYQLARRQLMWFKRNCAIHWLTIDTNSQEQIFDRAYRIVSDEILNS